MIEITERQFQSQVEVLAKLYGWKYYHPWNSMHSVRGYPDLTMVRGDRLIFAELKTEKGTVTNKQEEWLDALDTAGAETYVWRPSDWPQIEETLR